MREIVRVLLICCVMIGLAGCGQETEVTSENVEDAIMAEVEEQTGAEPSDDTTPCEILDDELILAHFDVPDGTEITRTPSKYSPHPLCSVSWPKPNAAEIEEKMGEAMMEYMQKKMKGEDVERPNFRTSNELTLTLNEGSFDSSAEAMSAFDSSMKRLSEGITASHEDVEMTFQADLDPVEGVGDKAMWAAKMHQLSVVDGVEIFHVTVNTGAELEADLEKAKQIARDIAERL